MARTTAGSQLIPKLRPAIERRGVTVPKSMTGGVDAAAFTHKLGLPDDLAGTRNTRREPIELVHGPVRLPPLHGYQAETIVRVRKVLEADGWPAGSSRCPRAPGRHGGGRGRRRPHQGC